MQCCSFRLAISVLTCNHNPTFASALVSLHGIRYYISIGHPSFHYSSASTLNSEVLNGCVTENNEILINCSGTDGIILGETNQKTQVSQGIWIEWWYKRLRKGSLILLRNRSDMTHQTKALRRWILNTSRLDTTHQTLTNLTKQEERKIRILNERILVIQTDFETHI